MIVPISSARVTVATTFQPTLATSIRLLHLTSFRIGAASMEDTPFKEALVGGLGDTMRVGVDIWLATDV